MMAEFTHDLHILLLLHLAVVYSCVMCTHCFCQALGLHPIVITISADKRHIKMHFGDDRNFTPLILNLSFYTVFPVGLAHFFPLYFNTI